MDQPDVTSQALPRIFLPGHVRSCQYIKVYLSHLNRTGFFFIFFPRVQVRLDFRWRSRPFFSATLLVSSLHLVLDLPHSLPSCPWSPFCYPFAQPVAWAQDVIYTCLFVQDQGISPLFFDQELIVLYLFKIQGATAMACFYLRQNIKHSRGDKQREASLGRDRSCANEIK